MVTGIENIRVELGVAASVKIIHMIDMSEGKNVLEFAEINFVQSKTYFYTK